MPARHRRLPSALLIFAVCATAYFLARTPALDEWDSVQFALAVGDFDLWKHQPHPPGYPLFIAGAKLFHALLPALDTPGALQLVSALGGGLFVACWFVLVARRFGEFAGWLCTAALATLLILWMTATKSLTDPPGAGLLALTLLLADTSRRRENDSDPFLAATAAAGALAVGVRPQNFGVALLIVVLAVLAVRRPYMGRRWGIGAGVFLGANLLWLVPTMVVQARAPEAAGDWLAYPKLLLMQWRWRLDQPKAFIGAAGEDSSLWLYRLDHHVFGLFTRGFGFAPGSAWGWLGMGVLVAGWVLCVRSRRADGGEESFWRQHLPWAAFYYVTVSCFLPGDQRYYLPIFPLLILPAVLGWETARSSRWLALLVPTATLAATLPFIGPNHRDDPPPVQMIRWLQAHHPPAERPRVWLILTDSLRHAQWYAPDFHVVPPGSAEPIPWPPHDAVYTDDIADARAMRLLSTGHWQLMETFRRSPLIYRKHNTAVLYRWTPDVR